MAHQIGSIVALVFVVVVIVLLALVEIIDRISGWMERREKIEKRWPKLWGLLINPAMRLSRLRKN